MLNEPKKCAPCIVNEGILLNKKDMLRALDTLENVIYYDVLDEKVISSGKGLVVKVFSSRDSSTIVLNETLFINVNSFKYLTFNVDEEGKTALELINDSRILRLIPCNEEPEQKQSNRLIQKSINNNEDFYYDDEEETFASLSDEFNDSEED
jgi:hypothetical protein